MEEPRFELLFAVKCRFVSQRCPHAGHVVGVAIETGHFIGNTVRMDHVRGRKLGRGRER